MGGSGSGGWRGGGARAATSRPAAGPRPPGRSSTGRGEGVEGSGKGGASRGRRVGALVLQGGFACVCARGDMGGRAGVGWTARLSTVCAAEMEGVAGSGGGIAGRRFRSELVYGRRWSHARAPRPLQMMTVTCAYVRGTTRQDDGACLCSGVIRGVECGVDRVLGMGRVARGPADTLAPCLARTPPTSCHMRSEQG